MKAYQFFSKQSKNFANELPSGIINSIKSKLSSGKVNKVESEPDEDIHTVIFDGGVVGGARINTDLRVTIEEDDEKFDGTYKVRVSFSYQGKTRSYDQNGVKSLTSSEIQSALDTIISKVDKAL